MSYTDDVTLGTDSPSPMMGTAVGITQAENKMAEFLVRKGIARSQSQAQGILLGVAIAAIVIGLVGWWYVNPSTSGQTYKGPLVPKKVSYKEVLNTLVV